MSASLVAAAVRNRGGIDWLFDQIAQGRTISALARDLAIGRSALSMWLNKPERKERLVAAQQEAAYAITDEQQDIADGIKPETGIDGTTVIVPMSEAIAKARLQIDVRRERAAVLNREIFGKQAPRGDNDLGEILVGALTAVAKRHALPPAKTEPMPAEIVPDQT